MTRVEAACYLGISPGTLANWGSMGTGPRFTWKKIPGRGRSRTDYTKADLDAWRGGGCCSACGQRLPLRERRRPTP